jgi:hypothetical protein
MMMFDLAHLFTELRGCLGRLGSRRGLQAVLLDLGGWRGTT